MLLKAFKLYAFLCITGVSLVIAGVFCLCLRDTTTVTAVVQETKYYEYDKQFIFDYSNCTDHDNKLCRELNMDSQSCICSEQINIDKDILGDVVVLYQLDKFNSTSSVVNQTDYFHSRDDKQLSGILTDAPAKACHPYDYDENNITIAPCGAIANAMFNDVFFVEAKDEKNVPFLNTGLLLDGEKTGFRNPASTDNLTVAFQNFSKPIDWTKHIWELDSQNPDNNGFQNEAFIAWMRTDWDLKPALRLNRSESGYERGLPQGVYTLYVEYKYPVSMHSGIRNFIIATRRLNETETPQTPQTEPGPLLEIGISALVIGILLLILSVALLLYCRARVAGTKPVNANSDIVSNSHNPEPSSSQRPDRTSLLNSEHGDNLVENNEEDILAGKGTAGKYSVTGDHAGNTNSAVTETGNNMETGVYRNGRMSTNGAGKITAEQTGSPDNKIEKDKRTTALDEKPDGQPNTGKNNRTASVRASQPEQRLLEGTKTKHVDNDDDDDDYL